MINERSSSSILRKTISEPQTAIELDDRSSITSRYLQALTSILLLTYLVASAQVVPMSNLYLSSLSESW